MTNWKVKLHVGGIEVRDTCDVYDVGEIDAGEVADVLTGNIIC